MQCYEYVWKYLDVLTGLQQPNYLLVIGNVADASQGAISTVVAQTGEQWPEHNCSPILLVGHKSAVTRLELAGLSNLIR